MMYLGIFTVFLLRKILYFTSYRVLFPRSFFDIIVKANYVQPSFLSQSYWVSSIGEKTTQIIHWIRMALDCVGGCSERYHLDVYVNGWSKTCWGWKGDCQIQDFISLPHVIHLSWKVCRVALILFMRMRTAYLKHRVVCIQVGNVGRPLCYASPY